MSESKPCIMVADDDFDTRKTLHDYLTDWGAQVLVAADGNEALLLADRHPVDIAILDVVMPGPAGMGLAACLQAIDPDIDVIIITAYGTPKGAADAMQGGAFYYLCKPYRLYEVRERVALAWQQQLARMRIQVGDWIVDLRQKVVTVDGRCKPLADLSRREWQVLDCLLDGCSDQEIARRLEIAESTAKAHIRNILRKLYATSRTQLAVFWERYRNRNQY